MIVCLMIVELLNFFVKKKGPLVHQHIFCLLAQMFREKRQKVDITKQLSSYRKY